MRVVGLSALMAVLLTLASPCWAADPLELVYVRGPGAEACPGEMSLRLAVTHRLGYDPFQSGPRRRAVVLLEVDGERLLARFDMVDELGVSSGARSLTGTTELCAELVRALALSISIAIDADRNEAVSDEPPSAWRFARSDTAAEHDAGSSAGGLALDRDAMPRFSFRLGLGGQAAVGVAPGVAWGALVSGSVRHTWYSVGVELRADAPTSEAITGGGEFSSRLLAGTVAPCLHLNVAMACALGSVGAVRAASHGIAQPRSDSGLYAALGLRAGAEWQLGAVALQANIDARKPLKVLHIAVDDHSVWTSPPLSFAGGGSVLWQFL